MRESCPGYTPRTDGKLQAMSETGIFAFDANALLNSYRVTESTRDAFFASSTLEGSDLASSLDWFGVQQSGLEYNDNRLDVIG